MPKQYQIGMTCRKHGACDIVAPHEGTAICSAPHHYEIYNPDHHYDLVFFTPRPNMYIEEDIDEEELE